MGERVVEEEREVEVGAGGCNWARVLMMVNDRWSSDGGQVEGKNASSIARNGCNLAETTIRNNWSSRYASF